MSNWQIVCKLKDFNNNNTKLSVSIKNKKILIIKNQNGEFYAIEDLCSHGNIPLSNGDLTNNYTIECWAHGGSFDLRTGKAVTLPATDPIDTFKIKVEKSLIYIDTDSIID